MKRIVLSLIIIAALSASVVQAEKKLRILSTIKPIHSLVSAISGDLASATQIIPNHASPHHYSLKPSDLRKINSADLIFRIDANLESFLQKSLRSVTGEKVISLANAKGISLLHARSEHQHDKHDKKDDHQENVPDRIGHDHGTHSEADHANEETPQALDYHLWLSPDNAIAMAKTIRDSLVNIAPEHSEQFTENTDQLVSAIHKKSQEITQQFSQVKDTPFLVMHDAWQYYTRYYKLNQLGSISAQERLRSSAKSISKARATITRSKVNCLVTEPNLKTKTLRILTERLPITITEIDPLGREIPESEIAYPALLQYTADKLLNCLKKK